MKKLHQILIIVGVIAIMGSCKKDDTNEPTPSEKYSVNYEMKLQGNYYDLEISFIDTAQSVQQLSNPVMPWKKNYDDFKKGDTVFCNANFYATDTIFYELSVGVTGEGYINSGSSPVHTIIGQDTLKISCQWGCKID